MVQIITGCKDIDKRCISGDVWSKMEEGAGAEHGTALLMILRGGRNKIAYCKYR